MNTRMMITAAALMSAAPAMAQTALVPVAAPAAKPADPARLQIATRVAAELLPAGTYKSIMKSSMDQMANGMMDKMLDMPVRSFATIGGLSEKQAAKLGPATLRQIMAIADPAFDQRMKLTMQTMGGLMGDLMDDMEPEIRTGLGEALASRFSVGELTSLDQFFTTPVGASYARQSMAIYADPAIMQRMQGMMPRMLEKMPDWIKKMQAATAGLPKPKRPEDLTPAERGKIKALIEADPAATT